MKSLVDEIQNGVQALLAAGDFKDIQKLLSYNATEWIKERPLMVDEFIKGYHRTWRISQQLDNQTRPIDQKYVQDNE